MSFDFAPNSLQKLMSGPLAPWISFAVETTPAAAVLAFTFVFLLVSLIWFLTWCAGDPKKMLSTVLLLAPIVALYVAVFVGGVMALFGWPILWLFEQILGLPPILEGWAISVVQINYLSLGLVMGAALAVVTVLLVHGIWTEPRNVPYAKKLAHSTYGSEIVEIGELLKPEDYGRPAKNYRRIGLTVGLIFSAVPILAALFLARTGLTFSHLIYCGLAAVILFAIPYAISRSVGWILDNCISKLQAEAG